MNSYVIAGIVIVAALAFVAAPLLRRGRSADEQRPVAGPSPRASREAPRPSALDEIELDFAMGKLEKAEYETLRARYESELASAPTPAPIASPAADSSRERAEAMIRAQRLGAVSCANCGPRPEPAARFCSTCGRTLGSCPSCGAAIDDSAGRYCTSCGFELAG